MRAIVCIPCLAAKPLKVFIFRKKYVSGLLVTLHLFHLCEKMFCMVTEPISLDIMRHNDKDGSNRLRILYQILFLKPEHVFYLQNSCPNKHSEGLPP